MNDKTQSNTKQQVFRSPTFALVFLIVVYLIASFPFLTGTTTLDSEISNRLNPAFFFYHYSQIQGESSVIAPQISSGFPLSVSDWLYDPLNLVLLNLFPPAFAYAVREFLNLALAGIATFLLAYYGLRRAVFESLVAALIYTTTFPPIFVFQSFGGVIFFLLPLFFLILLRLGESEPMYGWKFWLLVGTGGIIFGYGILAMYTTFLLYLVVGGIATSIFFLFTLSGWRKRSGCFVGFLFTIILGVLIGSSHIARVLAFIPGSERASGLPYESDPVQVLDLIHLFFPPTMMQNNDVLLHFGSIGTILFFIGLFVVTEKRMKYIFGSIGILVLGIVLPYSPLPWLLHKIPLFSLFRGVKIWLTLGILVAALFAAYGAGWLFNSDRGGRYWLPSAPPKRVHPLFWKIGAFVVFYVLIFIPVWWEKVGKGTTVIPEMRPTVIEMGIPLLILVFWIIVMTFMARRKFFVSTGAWITLGLLAVNAIFPFMVYASKNGFSATVLSTPSVAEKILRDREGDGLFRIFPLWYNQISQNFILQKLPISIEDRVQVLRTIGAPNYIFYSPGLSTAEGSWQLTPARYQKALEAIRGRHYEFLYEEEAPLDKIQSHLGLLGMMNVKYLITYIDFPARADLPIVARFPLSLPSLGNTPSLRPQWMRFRYGPEVTDDGVLQEVAPDTQGSFLVMTVYENTRVLPRIFVPNAVSRAPYYSEDILFAPDHNYQTLTFIECMTCGAGRSGNANADITIEAYHNGAITFSYNATEETWLVISESNIPGWRATLDTTTPLLIETANGIYMGLRVPAGNHRVTLTYELSTVRDIPRLFKEFAREHFRK